MTIQFGREICGQLEAAASREWLVTNGIGGYACGTVSGQLTRAYHGLLVAALNPPVERSLLLTKLDETATYRGQQYPLYSNQWKADRWDDSIVSPHGYCHIEHFELEGTIPVWTFAIGDARLQKRVGMVRGENTSYVRYELTRGSGLDLSIKIIVNHRDHHGGSHPGDWRVTAAGNGICVQVSEDVPYYVFPSAGYPNKPQINPQWLRNVGLAAEHYRGTGDRDDHLQAAVLEVHLEPHQGLTLLATTEAAYGERPIDETALLRDRQRQDEALVARWRDDIVEQPSPPDWLAPLVLAADAFIVDRATHGVAGKIPGKTIIAGYPWFGDWGRDTMISLPGLTSAVGRPELARPILQTFGQHLSQGMLPNLFPDSGQAPEYNTVDAVLWYFEAVRSYYDKTQDRDLLSELFPALVDAIQWHQRGTRYGIGVDPEDGLLRAGEPGVQLTWMDAKVDDWVVTPRMGKPIEVNALWYNALRVMAYFARLLGQPDREFLQLAQHCRLGFGKFWSVEQGYCFDVIDTPYGDDASLRPNQIFAVALPYGSHLPGEALLPPEQQQAVVDTLSATLLTSYGLRSLAPHHPDYVGTYGGDRLQRDGAYHQGTVWGWLMGPFVQAHWHVYRDRAEALSFLTPCADHLRNAGLGTVSEIFDGDAPHRPRGCFAQAWSVAEILRVWQMISGAI